MENEQSLLQRKIALAQSEHASVVIEMMRDIVTKTNNIIGDTEYKTLLNAITLEVEANMLRRMADYLEEIRKGILHESK